MDEVELVIGDPGAEPDLSILIPENRIPWGGHSGRHAAREVMDLIERHKTTLVFCNTRSLAELIFQDLWQVNDKALPIGIHHGSLAQEARRKVEAAMAAGKLRALVATASLDLGIDWGDVDLVVQMGAPKGSSRLLQRIGRANHRLDEPSEGVVVPGNRFEYLEARAALDAIDDGELDPENFRPGTLDVLAQHILAMAVRRTVRGAGAARGNPLCRALRRPQAIESFTEVLNFIATGGYALKAYERFRRLVPEAGGTLAHRPAANRAAAPTQCRASSSSSRCSTSASETAESLARVEEGYASTLAPGDHFYFSGLSLEVEQIQGHRHHRPGLVQAGADRHLRRPAHVHVDAPRRTASGTCSPTATTGIASPTTSANGWRCRTAARSCPSRSSCWSRRSSMRSCTTWSHTASKAGTRTSRSAC